MSTDVESPKQRPSPVVISLHGIRTRGVWQKELTSELNIEQFVHEPLDYGFFDSLRFLCPGARRNQVNWFRDEYTRLRERYPGKELVIIAHSFGTYLVTRALELYPQSVRFDQVILCGSIVREDYPWPEVFANGQVGRVLHEYGRLDFWARMVAWFVEDAGPSGVRGFQAPTDERLVQWNHPEFGHSDYFYRLHYRDVWIPFLKGTRLSQHQSAAKRQRNWKYYATRSVVYLLFLSLAVWLAFYWFGSPPAGDRPKARILAYQKQAEKEADNPTQTLGGMLSNVKVDGEVSWGEYLARVPKGEELPNDPFLKEESGFLVYFSVQLEGFMKRDCPVTLVLYDAKKNKRESSSGPSRIFIPDKDKQRDTATSMGWIQAPPRAGRYYVKVELHDDQGIMLHYADTDAFDWSPSP